MAEEKETANEFAIKETITFVSSTLKVAIIGGLAVILGKAVLGGSILDVVNAMASLI